MQSKKDSIYFLRSLVFAIWFALTASAWTYFANLFISLPSGILSLIFWRKGKASDIQHERYRYVPVILITGSVISIAVLIWYLMFE